MVDCPSLRIAEKRLLLQRYFGGRMKPLGIMTAGKSPRLRFLVQEHDATRLHWDFRLELDGVLKSWAVPKGQPTEPGANRLAVPMPYPPLSHFDFGGRIPEGGYGGGAVKVWGKGRDVFSLREPR